MLLKLRTALSPRLDSERPPLTPRIVIVTFVAFLAVGIFRLPLVWVLAGIIPLTIVAAWFDPNS